METTVICTKETSLFKKDEKYPAFQHLDHYYKVYFDPNNPFGFCIFNINSGWQSSNFKNYFLTLDEWRNLKLNELGI